MKICLFDDVLGGHHQGYVSGLTHALLARGVETVVATPLRLAGVQDDYDWLQIDSFDLREVLRGRRELTNLVRKCRSRGVDRFWNLNLDKTIWAVPGELGNSLHMLHILHHAHQYNFQDRTLGGKLRTAVLRHRLRSLTVRGDYVVTHTPRALEILEGFLPSEHLQENPYPIKTFAHQPETNALDPTQPAPTQLLFVGQARREKGLHLLLEALEDLPDHPRLQVVGPQKPATRHELEARFDTARVNWVDRFVDDDELRRFYVEGSLVVVPYSDSFARDGGASGVLLDGLTFGAPMVVSTAVADQLPEEYRGTLVVDAQQTRSFASGLSTAIRDFSEMRDLARRDGPSFIRERHSFSHYVDALLELPN